MTLFGIDTSHYDGVITPAIAAHMVAEGISFATHKLGEGTDNTDTTAGPSLTALRDAGIQVLGGYYFIHHRADPVAQARRCVQLADAAVPWWRTFDGWVWQCDAESEPPYGLPSLAEVKAFCDTLAAETGRVVMAYASRGQYGNRLDGLDHPLWNADYGTQPVGPFKTIYPGDGGRGWTAYSGQTPVFWQYGSGATIAGLTTCDANAFRGSLEDLLTLIGATDMPLTDADVTKTWTQDGVIDNRPWRADVKTNTKIRPDSAIEITMDEAHGANAKADQILAGLAAAAKVEGATLAAIQALASPGTSVDTAAVIAAITAVGATESAAITSLRTALAAAEQAAAAALAKPAAPGATAK